MAVQKVDATTYYPDEEKYADCVINVRDTGEIAFEYTWYGQRYVFIGKEEFEGSGKYVLKCPKIVGGITLYKLPDDSGFIGRWTEKGAGHGLWEIDFSD